jgi:hypothetical protein
MTRLFDGLSRYICPYLLNHFVGMVAIEPCKPLDASVLIILASDMRIEGHGVESAIIVRQIQLFDVGHVPFGYGLITDIAIMGFADFNL